MEVDPAASYVQLCTDACNIKSLKSRRAFAAQGCAKELLSIYLDWTDNLSTPDRSAYAEKLADLFWFIALLHGVSSTVSDDDEFFAGLQKGFAYVDGHLDRRHLEVDDYVLASLTTVNEFIRFVKNDLFYGDGSTQGHDSLLSSLCNYLAVMMRFFKFAPDDIISISKTRIATFNRSRK